VVAGGREPAPHLVDGRVAADVELQGLLVALGPDPVRVDASGEALYEDDAHAAFHRVKGHWAIGERVWDVESQEAIKGD